MTDDISFNFLHDSGTDWFGVRHANIKDVTNETLKEALEDITRELKRRGL
jgi:hypothetical protein